MKSLFTAFAALICLCSMSLPAPAAGQTVDLSVSIHPANRELYRKAIAQHGHNPHQITDYGVLERRSLVELVLSIQAVALGGLEPRVTFLTTPNVGRETLEVARGNALMASQAYNSATFEAPEYRSSVFMSAPVIRLGEFEKGFYGPVDRRGFHCVESAEELNRDWVGVIGLHWNQDAQTLKRLGVENIIRIPLFEAIPDMIQSGRADYVPLSFSKREDLTLTLGGKDYAPIPGLKFALLETRHLMVSRTHPDGERVFRALQRGLAIMRQRGTIVRAYTECGFFQPRVADWTLLNKARLEELQTRQSRRDLPSSPK
ncbi:hypothetical protein [Salidesulfovibrio brasiliensis]